MRVFVTSSAFAALLLVAASAQQPPAKQDAVSTQGYGDIDKVCLEWNDGCRTCRRPEGGEAACSNIGIACQPAAVTCTRRAEEKK